MSLDAAVHANGDGVLTSSGGGKRGRSLVHGDLKTWNVFFKTTGWAEPGEQGEGAAARDGGGGDAEGPAGAAGGKVKIIDWQVWFVLEVGVVANEVFSYCFFCRMESVCF